MEAHFGPTRLVLTGAGQVERPIKVLFQPFFGGGAIVQHDKTSELLRAGIWQHKKLNRDVAKIADSLASGDLAALAQIVKGETARNVLASAGAQPRVAILVANIEQAIQVLWHLRGWKLVSGKSVQIDGLSAEDLKILRFARRQPNRPAKGLVVTPAGLERVRRSDILIRADGGVGRITTRWAVQSANAGVFSPVVILDLRDRRHPVLRKRSRQRLAAYLEAGWRLPGKYRHELDQFQATRPKF
jgi:hypothetical protein